MTKNAESTALWLKEIFWLIIIHAMDYKFIIIVFSLCNEQLLKQGISLFVRERMLKWTIYKFTSTITVFSLSCLVSTMDEYVLTFLALNTHIIGMTPPSNAIEL